MRLSVAKEKWIQSAIQHKGALRKTMRVEKGQNIPVSKLKKAASGKNVSKLTEKRSKLALTLRNLGKRK